MNKVPRKPLRMFERLILREVGIQLQCDSIQTIAQHHDAVGIVVANPVCDCDERGCVESGAFQADSKDAGIIRLSSRRSISSVLEPRRNRDWRSIAESQAKLGGIQ